MTEGLAPIAPNPSVRGKRGVIYVKWGAKDAALRRSIRSVREFHPDLPIVVRELPENASLLEKSTMMNWAPFEETLYLDLDTVVMGRLDFGFDMAIRHGLACSICECPWARRYNGIKTGDLVEYNTGVLFFTRKARPIFDAWSARVGILDSSVKYEAHGGRIGSMPVNDQAGFALALAEAPTLPFVLPLNWNFRPRWHLSLFGPIKIWHDYRDPPQDVLEFSRRQSLPGAVIEFRSFPLGKS